MTAKEFLQQVYLAHHEVEICLEEISQLQSLATRTTTVIRGVPNGGQTIGSQIENSITQMDTKAEELAEKIKVLVEDIDKVRAAISQVKNSNERMILKYRYLCFFSWQQISFLMKTSLRQIYRIHNDALENFFVNVS